MLLLSWPPSVNDLYRAFRGRNILSAKARKWYEDGKAELLLQRATPVIGTVEIAVELASPTKRRYDPDNRIKAIFDLLVRCGIIEDDDNATIKRYSVDVDGEGFLGARVTIRKV